MGTNAKRKTPINGSILWIYNLKFKEEAKNKIAKAYFNTWSKQFLANVLWNHLKIKNSIWKEAKSVRMMGNWKFAQSIEI